MVGLVPCLKAGGKSRKQGIRGRWCRRRSLADLGLNGRHFLPCLRVPSLVWLPEGPFPCLAGRCLSWKVVACSAAHASSSRRSLPLGLSLVRRRRNLECSGDLVSRVLSWGGPSPAEIRGGAPTTLMRWPRPRYSLCFPSFPSHSSYPARSWVCQQVLRQELSGFK